VITIGVDAHKAVHVAVAVDDAGREVGQWRGRNSVMGWTEVQGWAAELGDVRQWGIEGAWSYGRGLAQQLVGCEEVVYEVNTRWTALGRRTARKQDKTDGLDARAVALFLRQEPASLPRVHPEDDSAVLDLLTGERGAALVEATRLRNQIHALLMQLDPEYRERGPRLDSRAGLRAAMVYATEATSAIQLQRAATVRRLAARLHLALAQADEVAKQIKAHASTTYLPLTKMCGVNLLTAGALAGILGPGGRFKTDAQLAAYGGAAPLEASSAGAVRHRLNRGGNRKLNAVLYRIGLTQAHYSTDARTYLARRVAEGKTKREAMRALKRYIARAIWQLWQECEPVAVGIAEAA
jgi:transposase